MADSWTVFYFELKRLNEIEPACLLANEFWSSAEVLQGSMIRPDQKLSPKEKLFVLP
jgi:hypothetical protein